MLLRLGLSTLLIAVSPLGRGCTPASAPVAHEAAGSIAQPTPAPEPATPPPPARAHLAPDAVGPESSDGPDGRTGVQLRSGIAALEGGRFEDALALLPPRVDGPVADLGHWTRARTLRALQRGAEADPVLAMIGQDSRYGTEATLARAEIALDDGRPADALTLLGGFEEPDRYGADHARADLLRARAFDARGAEGDLQEASSSALRVWRGAPGSQADSDATVLLDALERRLPAELRRGLGDSVERARSLGRRHGKRAIVKLLGGERGKLVALASTEPEVACTGLFELGRALHKQRDYAGSVPVLVDADGVCAGDEQVKTLYLLAQGRTRSGQVTDGITTFLRLPDEHPLHSYADDGLWQASRLALDEGMHADAAAHAQRLVDSFPDGDMRGSTVWNLAWSAIAAGRPGDGLPWLELMGSGDPLGPDREHVLQGRYWTARVLLETTPARRDEALRSIEKLAVDHPLHWYGTLGGWLLSREDPARASNAERVLLERAALIRAAPAEPDVYTPLQEFVDLPGVQSGMAYLRAGLLAEAAEELGEALGKDGHERWSDPETLLFAAHLLEAAGDPARSHNLLRRACKTSFPEASPEQAATLMHAWPRAFAAEIELHTTTYAWDSMLFQGLVREESAFSPTVVSWAGAIGLSQLMWPTAKETARRMGIRVSRADLRDPSTNVHIGTTYFEGLAKRWKGHLPLAVASYNAGPGAVKRWVDARGHLELDAWVETIPYDQTRHYVKRVVSSWQAYRFLYGEGDGWVPLRVGPVAEGIAQADPRPPTQNQGG